jgi:ABC-type molybdate transport system substrate-binding protein
MKKLKRKSVNGWIVMGALGILFFPAAHACAAQRAMPPWSGGRNNPAGDKGYVFEVSEVNNVPDLHGNPGQARLVLFIAGNQFMVLPQLVEAFEAQHPELRGRIYYETLPPGILLRQMDNQNTLTLGNLTLTVQPDVYEAGARRLEQLSGQGRVGDVVRYASNDLAIMVRKGNPKQIHSLRDLGRTDVRVSMPNPEWEGVAQLIEKSLRKAGGDALVRQIMVAKRRQGTTFLTHIHHRQTPMRISKGLSDAGVTWQSEVKFQESIGNPISGVKIPAKDNTTGIYAAGVLTDAPHRQAAEEWVKFLRSSEAQSIYRSFGFGIPEQK